MISREQLRRWRHLSKSEFHFSEDWRTRYSSDLDQHLRYAGVRDSDLAIQIATARARGIRLAGGSRSAVLPGIPLKDQLASATQDFTWAKARLAKDPVYFVLNACRILALIKTKRILSKDEGVRWALKRVPLEHRPVLRWARDVYRGRG